MQEKQWSYKESKAFEKEVQSLVESLNVSNKLALMLAQRGINNFEQAKDYFRPSWEKTHSPFLMLNMKSAVERILKALENKQKILVYGDYDVDGTTAVAMVYSFLSEHTDKVLYYIPNRYLEGYGVSEKGIEFAIEQGVSLIITLDCGIKAIEKIQKARNNNIDVIVGDHHLPGDVLPDAIILNAKQQNCPYPFKELSGAGVAFKLVQALCEKMNLNEEKSLQFLDVLALGTGADMVSLTGENRIFTHFGLQKINENPSGGIKAILNVAKCKTPINIRDIGFSIAPRINAAGRVDDAKKIIELLTSGNPEIEKELSQAISSENEYRRELDQDMTQEALSIIYSNDDFDKKKSTVIFKADWHKGVIGIVASRLQEKIYKPTIVLTESNGKITGSARSVKDFNIHDAINSCSHLLESFGGHAFAAGLTMLPENLAAFTEAFENTCSKIENENYIPEIPIDCSVNFDELNGRFFRILWQFEPFGVDNPAPVFSSENIVCFPDVKVMSGKHLKLRLCQKHQPEFTFEAVAFNQIHQLENIKTGKPFSICYSPELNSWNNQKITQLNIKDFHF